NDPFRGKYITLSFSDISMNVTNASDWSYNDPAYITFRLDSSGFAIPTNIFREIPTNSESYLKVKVRNVISSHEEQTIFIDYPFDRFYLEETKAPQIEEKYREALADSSIQTFARIYVQSGKGVIEDIYIGERRIGDLAR
ncbi:MAG: GDYXXLXY domain-containing protein, partial [Saprospiraceae bacterium]|nr:GDYXXLXY domain-containing protein [Saprospiraceae bacterium]